MGRSGGSDEAGSGAEIGGGTGLVHGMGNVLKCIHLLRIGLV
jgi:hypothetical protein